MSLRHLYLDLTSLGTYPDVSNIHDDKFYGPRIYKDDDTIYLRFNDRCLMEVEKHERINGYPFITIKIHGE